MIVLSGVRGKTQESFRERGEDCVCVQGKTNGEE